MADDLQAPGGSPLTETSKPVSAIAELGGTGLKRAGGYVNEEYLPELRGPRGIKIFREMSENDSTCGAILFAIEMLIRSVKWAVKPFSEDAEDQAQADFVESLMDDMEQPWAETIVEILSMLRYGWSLHEVVYKFRRGDSDDPAQRSKHNDGLLGWRKMPIRSQDSMQKWEFSESGDILGMDQIAPPTYRLVHLPMTKCLLFRTTTHKGNPEGQSILRRAYRPWYMKKHIENIEAVGAERDLAGLPIIWIPEHFLASDATAEDKKVAAAYKQIITNLKRDEQEGIVMPLSYDENGNKEYDLTLLSNNSRRNFDTGGIVTRYSRDIAMTVLADFIFLGHEKVGSYALSSSKTTMFAQAIGAWLGSISDVINRHEIPRILKLNGMKTDRPPSFIHEDIETMDLKELGDFLTAMTGAGAALFPDEKLEEHLRLQAGFPEKDVSAQKRLPSNTMQTPAAQPNPGPSNAGAA